MHETIQNVLVTGPPKLTQSITCPSRDRPEAVAVVNEYSKSATSYQESLLSISLHEYGLGKTSPSYSITPQSESSGISTSTGTDTDDDSVTLSEESSGGEEYRDGPLQCWPDGMAHDDSNALNLGSCAEQPAASQPMQLDGTSTSDSDKSGDGLNIATNAMVPVEQLSSEGVLTATATCTTDSSLMPTGDLSHTPTGNSSPIPTAELSTLPTGDSQGECEGTAVDIYDVKFCGIIDCPPTEGGGGGERQDLKGTVDAPTSCTPPTEGDGGECQDSKDTVDAPTSFAQDGDFAAPEQPQADCDIFNVKLTGMHVF